MNRKLCFLCFLLFSSVWAAVPQLINHQGRIAVNGTNFEGTGQFKFALVSTTGTTTYWSNDNTSTAGSQPTAAVSLPVVKGLYSVLLGDAGMTALPTTVFDNADVRLRVWFNDGTIGFQQITPDQRLASAPFALNAAKAESVSDGSITSAKIAAGAVTADKVAVGSIGSTQLASAAVQSSNIAAGAVTSAQMGANAITASNLATGTRSGTTLDGVLNFSTPGFMSSTVPFTPPLNLTPTLAPAVGWSFSAITTSSFTTTRSFLPVNVTAVGAVTSSSDTFLATVASGRPAIAYHDNTGARLKYAVAPTADGSGTWTTVDIGGTPGGSNLARISLVTIGGTPFISYRASSLTLARASSADGSGTWTNITVPGAGLGNHASLAEVNGKPAIAYSNGGGSNLRYAFNSAADGSGTWTVVVVDNNNGSGIHTSLAVVDGLPAISYRDSGNNLAFVRATTATGSAWGTPISLGAIGTAGGWTSLKIVDGRPAISYYDAVTGDLDYIRAADATGTTWQAPVTIDSTGTVGTYTSLAIVNGHPAISYYDQTGTNLKFAYASTVDGSGTWATATIETTGTIGQSTSLAVVNGSPAISYFDNTNATLKYASIPVLNWSASEFGTAGPIASTSFIGNGSALTNLNGSSLTAGTVGSPQITDLSIVNADVSTTAAIADTKLATISSVGKVANSATTGTATNTPSTLVLRDASGNFAAGSITGTFVGNGAGLTGVTASSVLLGSVIAPPIKPVVAWGDNHDGQTSVPTTLINANTAAIAAGGSVGVALLKSGTVVQWGTGTAVPGGLVNVTHIAAGTAHRLARKSDGTVTAWGDNTFGQSTVPGGLTTATNVAAGEKHSLALRANGTVIAWGDNSFTQTTVPGTATNVTAIAAGYDHSLALKADGTVVAWGRDDSGQSTGTRPILGTILGIIDATHYQLSKNLAAGTANLFYNGMAGPSSASDGSDIVTADTTTLSAGMIVSAPGIVGPAGLTNVVAIAAGAHHSLAVKSDGTVIAWGWETGGQINVPPGLTGISKVAGGYAYSLALKNDGTLIAWGDNTDGQTIIPTAAVNVTAIAAGPSHALALRADLIPAQVARLDQDNVFTGKVGIQRAPAANTLEVEGQASKNTAGNWLANSDRRIKDNIKPITGALEKLSQVRLVDFNYTADYRAAHPGIEDKRYLNVIAQDFAEVFPDDVKSSGEKMPDGSPILQVDTYPLTIYSAAAVQELAKENAALRKQLADQEARLKKLEALIK